MQVEKRLSFKQIPTFLIAMFFCCSLNPLATASPSNFGLIFDHNGDKLDTFNGTFTKNMHASSAPIVIKLAISDKELDEIYQKMVEMDFFNYPKEITISKSSGPFLVTHPGQSFYFKVEGPTGIKELSWSYGRTDPQDQKVIKLHGLISLIENIIYSKEEVKKLPVPAGMPL